MRALPDAAAAFPVRFAYPTITAAGRSTFALSGRKPSRGCHDEVMALSRRQQQEAADGLRRLLEAVQRGDLTVDGRAANAMLRRLEGALLALEAVLGTPTDRRR